MKRIHIGIVVLIFLVLITGCRTRNPAAIYHTLYDTITKEKIISYRDTVFKTEKVQVTITTPCDSITEQPQKKKDKNATLSLSKDKQGKLVADCQCDTIALKAKIKSELQKESQKSHKKEVEIKEVEYTPLLTKVLAWIGTAFIGCILVTLIVKYIKNKINQ
jgi:hypothetical protein